MTKREARTEKLSLLRTVIAKGAIIRNKGIGKSGRKSKWIFDLRLILLGPEGLRLATDVLRDEIERKIKRKNYCLGCLTIAGDPLVGSLVYSMGDSRRKKVNGFIIRKQKKTYGLQKIIEGNLNPKKGVILVDDLINSGSSLKKATEIIEREGGAVSDIFVLVDFKRGLARKFFQERNIKIHSLFGLDDFDLKLSSYGWQRNVVKDQLKTPSWIFKPLNVKNQPFYHSAPTVSDGLLYVGSDTGVLYCISAKDGEKVWDFPTRPTRKGILSSPLVLNELVLFGDYNGVLHCLNRKTGSIFWQSKICDFIGSSPISIPGENLVFIGTEYGKRSDQWGGVSCIDVKSGNVIWATKDPMYVHCTPAGSFLQRAVLVGSNSGKIFCLDYLTGKKRWERKTVGGLAGEIKFRLMNDDEEENVYLGSFDGNIYCFRIATGMPLWKFATGGPVKFSPLVYNNMVFCGSDDANLYCLDKKNGVLLWKLSCEAKLIGGMARWGDVVFVGDTGGVIYSVDTKQGKIINWVETDDSFFSAPCINGDRIFIGNKYMQCWEVKELI